MNKNFDNDAASCYDQILMSVASLSGRKYGVHRKIVYVHAATLEEAEYKLKLSSKTSNTLPRTIRRMSRKRLHIRHVPGRIEKRYFDNDENGIFKL